MNESVRDAPLPEPEAKANLHRLPALLTGLREAKGPDRRTLASALNDTLVAMRAPGHEQSESVLVLDALEGHHLDGLVDDQGRACRKEAVETLLACGFPHALKVSPEDLEFARSWVAPAAAAEAPWVDKMRTERRVAMILAVAFQAIAAGLIAVFADAPEQTMRYAYIACVMSALLFVKNAFSKPTPEDQGQLGMGAGILALGQAASAIGVGLPALVGTAGTVIALIVCIGSQGTPRADSPKPGDWDHPG